MPLSGRWLDDAAVGGRGECPLLARSGHQSLALRVSGYRPITDIERAAKRLLALPMHGYLDEAAQQRVCSAIIGALG